MPKEDSFGQVASVFQQISDCTRLRILWLLCHTTASVGAIARAVGMSDSAVSHHLRVLRADGLVSAKRSGKEVYYTLAASDKARLLHRTIDAMFEIACPSGDD
ncbi:MAG TPA: winged helix-turn-helix transcriptional regulator [Candidatus Caccocola faecipullorum]|nr:winged helix-turn-helix transcriptional regulator [Candidatus Caccocola faecipullorum]